jgi:hypothetical protein
MPTAAAAGGGAAGGGRRHGGGSSPPRAAARLLPAASLTLAVALVALASLVPMANAQACNTSSGAASSSSGPAEYNVSIPTGGTTADAWYQWVRACMMRVAGDSRKFNNSLVL